MKKTLTVLLLSCTFLGACQTRHTAADFKKLDWLTGTWQGEADGQPFFENWEQPGATELANVNFSICNGDTVSNGRSKIELRNGKIAYTSGQLSWPLKMLGDSLVIFENKQRGEVFTFTLTGSGKWNVHLQYPASETAYLLSRTSSPAALIKNNHTPIVGYYEGYIEFQHKRLLIAIRLDTLNGRQVATTSAPDNLQLNMPFAEVCLNRPYLKLTLRDGMQNLTLSANITNDEITGSLSGEIPAKLYCRKGTEPQKNPLYRVVALNIQNGDIALPASLFLPNTDKPAGAVVMICGTGQHVKEEYNGWADLLASAGVAVLTYTKRNVTAFPGLNIRHAGSDIVLPGQLEGDIEAAVKLLKGRPEINPQKIGLLGFSQGAVLAPIAASKSADVAFLAAISGNVTTDKEFIIHQALNRLRQRNADEQTLAEAREIWNSLFQYVKDRKNAGSIQQQLDNAFEKGFGRYALPRFVPNDDEMKYLSTWNSFEHDPAGYWRRLTIPSYVVYGDRDFFIPVKESAAILNAIFKEKPHLLTLRVYPRADHFIKKVIDPGNFEFPKYADGYIKDLAAWIIQQSK